MPAFHVKHFGCRAARADGEALGARLRAAGLVESAPGASDVVVVNTCSVTAEADRAACAFIRRAHRLNPAARIVVTGCYAQRAPQELASLPGVRAVVGNSHKAMAPKIALGLAERGSRFQAAAPGELLGIAPAPQGAAAPPPMVLADDLFAHSFVEDAPPLSGQQTRPNLKIQEGCSNRCAFCVIPQTRGPSKSLPHAAVLRQVETFIAGGGRELVLSGVNLGRWGRDLDAAGSLRRPSLASLVREIMEGTPLEWLRLSSIEPMDWDDELIALLREYGGRRICRHAHLPLQSGSDAVLRRMHRRYRPWHYAAKVQALLAATGADLTLGADVMVGFPGESDADFDRTLAFLRSLPFGYLHLFPFSPRPGTAGWALHAAAPVPAAVAAERMSVLRVLAAEKTLAHRRAFVGRDLQAITLHTSSKIASRNRTAALTENFLPVELEGSFSANQRVRARIAGLDPEARLRGEKIP